MNTFFEYYVDNTALITTFIVTLIITILTFRKKTSRLWAVPAFIAFLAPSAIITFMAAHIANNIFNAVDLLISRIFEYNFRFYSLMLLGFVVGGLGISYLNATRKYLAGFASPGVMVSRMLLILATTLPMVPLTPIAAVPSIAIVISSLGLLLAKRRRRVRISQDIIPELQMAS